MTGRYLELGSPLASTTAEYADPTPSATVDATEAWAWPTALTPPITDLPSLEVKLILAGTGEKKEEARRVPKNVRLRRLKPNLLAPLPLKQRSGQLIRLAAWHCAAELMIAS